MEGKPDAKIRIFSQMNYLCATNAVSVMTKAIVFDMGGVLIDLDKELCMRNFRDIAGFDNIRSYLDIYHQKGFIGAFEEGTYTEEVFYEHCLKHCAPGTTPEQVAYCLESLLVRVNPHLSCRLQDLSSRFDLYVLSNNNPICTRRFYHLMEEAGLLGYFRDMFFSYRLGMLKPSPGIYRALISKVGCRPDEILFVDDSTANVEGAVDVGINAVLYEDGMPFPY